MAALLAAAGYFAWLATSTLPRFLIPILPRITCVTVLAAERGSLPNWLRRDWWAIALIASLYDFQAVIKSGGVALGESCARMLMTDFQSQLLPTPDKCQVVVSKRNVMEWVCARLAGNRASAERGS